MSWLKASSIVWLFVDPPGEKFGFLLWKLLSRAASAASDTLTKALIWRILAPDTYMPNLNMKSLEAKYGLLPLTFERQVTRAFVPVIASFRSPADPKVLGLGWFRAVLVSMLLREP